MADGPIHRLVADDDPASFACPRCHQIDQVQKVSAAYRAGITETRGETRGVVLAPGRHHHHLAMPAGGIHIDRSQTSLSKMLEPPRQPSVYASGCLAALMG